MTDNVPDTRIGGAQGIAPGRKKGSKNKSTILREALTNDFEEQLQTNFKRVIEVVCSQAVEGCRQSQKLLLDRVIPTVHAESDKDKGGKFSGGISITIGTLEPTQSISVTPDVIDGDYEEIED